MCGIFGVYKFNDQPVALSNLEEMEKSIRSRGPDDRSFFIDDFVGLGMNRLAILDINNGKQPFVSSDNRIFVFQNGEIYNYLEIQKELKTLGYRFFTNSDTEVILRAYECWGENFVSYLNGMFSISIYDKKTKILRLYRDRIGVKPLYYYKDDNKFVFSSEIKSIIKSGVPKKIDLMSLNKGMMYGYIPCPNTLFQNIYHLTPGSFLLIDRKGAVIEKKWWDISNYVEEKKDSLDYAKNHLSHLMEEATKIRLRADVEVGAFLSGGVDSSYVVGLASAHTQSPMRTYSIGFKDPKFDETPFALEASNLFRTKHHMQYFTEKDVAIWKKIIHITDQPHSDVSFMPTFRVAESASASMKVVLTGDGGDEVFGGYEKYNFLENNDSLYESKADLFTKYVENVLLITDQETKSNLYNTTLMKEFTLENDKVFLKEISKKFENLDSVNMGLVFDMLHLMPSNNLIKPDRMGMANSLEARSPFLDYRLIEYAFGLPGNFKVRNGEKKFILKAIAEPIIGKNLTYRKKQMFTVPIGDWFQGGLANLVESKLNSKILKDFGFFNQQYISQIVNQHINNEKNNMKLIRFLISFVYFLENFFGDEE